MVAGDSVGCGSLWLKMVEPEVIQHLKDLGHTVDLTDSSPGQWQKRGLKPETRQLLERRFTALKVHGKEALGSFPQGLKKGLGDLTCVVVSRFLFQSL